MKFRSIIDLMRGRPVRDVSQAWKDLCFGDNGELKASAETALSAFKAYLTPVSGTVFHSDPQEMARRVGRQEAWDYVEQMLGMTEKDQPKQVENDHGD